MVSMARAIRAPARLTPDSRASESRPTEPVNRKAVALSPMVASAAAIESQAKRVRAERSVSSRFGMALAPAGGALHHDRAVAGQIAVLSARLAAQRAAEGEHGLLTVPGEPVLAAPEAGGEEVERQRPPRRRPGRRQGAGVD